MVFGENHNWVRYPELTDSEMEEFGFLSPHEQIVSDFTARVVKVHDGDTIRVECDFRNFDFPVRFLYIDAPELDRGQRGFEARDYLRGVIEGEEVLILVDRFNRVDKYGRLLGRVISAGQDVGEMMVHAGHAQLFEFRREEEVPSFNEYMGRSGWY